MAYTYKILSKETKDLSNGKKEVCINVAVSEGTDSRTLCHHLTEAEQLETIEAVAARVAAKIEKEYDVVKLVPAPPSVTATTVANTGFPEISAAVVATEKAKL